MMIEEKFDLLLLVVFVPYFIVLSGYPVYRAVDWFWIQTQAQTKQQSISIEYIPRGYKMRVRARAEDKEPDK